jgi:hypothetical protein
MSPAIEGDAKNAAQFRRQSQGHDFATRFNFTAIFFAFQIVRFQAFCRAAIRRTRHHGMKLSVASLGTHISAAMQAHH